MYGMEYIVYVFFLVLGLIVGSFLNVVIYRLHTGKSLNGRSHCMSCARTLSWHELLPVVSYMYLRGRCSGCSSYIPLRYCAVELLTGFLFLLTYFVFQNDWLIVGLNLVLVSLLIVIAVYDMRHTIIPDEYTGMVSVVAIVSLVIVYMRTGDIFLIVTSLLAGGCAAFFFWGLWYVSKGKWIGLGDAKLALPLGVIVGIGGAFSMVVLSFWIGAFVSLGILSVNALLKQGKTNLRFSSLPLTIKSEIPFAPFLVLGFLFVHFFHADIFEIIEKVFFSI